MKVIVKLFIIYFITNCMEARHHKHHHGHGYHRDHKNHGGNHHKNEKKLKPLKMLKNILSEKKHEEIKKEFLLFKDKFGVSYTGDEDSLRLKYFMKNYLHNIISPSTVFSINENSALSKRELKKKLGVTVSDMKELEKLDSDELVFMKKQFADYQKEFEKKYSSQMEQTLRFIIFVKNVNEINLHNQSNSTYQTGINDFTDRSFNEQFFGLKTDLNENEIHSSDV